VFTFATAFAYQPEELWKPVNMPMHRVTARTVCVETIDSKSYNRIVEEDDQTPRDWVQTDKMLRPDGLYRYGLLVNNNAPDTEPGAGSCILFHIWRRPGAPTAGCTAMNTAAIQVILAWLDSARQPILVQLPEAELAGWPAVGRAGIGVVRSRTTNRTAARSRAPVWPRLRTALRDSWGTGALPGRDAFQYDRRHVTHDGMGSIALVICMVAMAEFLGTKDVIFPEIAALAFGAWVLEERPWSGPPGPFGSRRPWVP
jgi:hypothetical protein